MDVATIFSGSGNTADMADGFGINRVIDVLLQLHHVIVGLGRPCHLRIAGMYRVIEDDGYYAKPHKIPVIGGPSKPGEVSRCKESWV